LDIVEHISTLLYKHNLLTIPEFGSFVSKYVPAIADLDHNRLSPPSKKITFKNDLTDDDGILNDYIAKKENISLSKVKEQTRIFVQSCQEILKAKEPLLWPKIGKFELDAKNNIIFEPDENANYLLDAFGLSTIKPQPIKKIITPTIRPQPIERPQPIKKETEPIYLLYQVFSKSLNGSV